MGNRHGVAVVQSSPEKITEGSEALGRKRATSHHSQAILAIMEACPFKRPHLQRPVQSPRPGILKIQEGLSRCPSRSTPPHLKLGCVVRQKSLRVFEDITFAHRIEQAQIGSGSEVGRSQPQSVERQLVVRHMKIGVVEQRAQMFHLIGLNLFGSPVLAVPN